MPALLTTASMIQCPHGGLAVLKTHNATTSAGARILVEDDIHDVMPCSFTIGTKYSPCNKIFWKNPATAVSVGGKKALTMTSLGECKSSEGVFQGFALIQNTQQKASAR
jgi:hypothetical protein